MKRQLGTLSDWCDSYLDVINSLHGVQESQPMSLIEIGDEWQRVFGAAAVGRTETDFFLGGSVAYMEAIAGLHGEWDLHPALSVQERCEEWQRCFGASVSLRVRNKPTEGEFLGTLASVS